MLPLWDNSVKIGLTPESISIKFAGKATEIDTVPSTSLDTLSWQGAIEALTNSANQFKGKKVKIILSNYFVRYVMLPWQQNIYTSNDFRALAQHHLTKIYGNVAMGWQVNVNLQGFGKPILVSAIDQSLLAQLQRLADDNKWQLDHIEPITEVVVQRYKTSIKRNDWLLINEPNRMDLFQMKANRIIAHEVTSMTDVSPQDEITALLDRQIKLNDNSPPRRVHLFSSHMLDNKIELDRTVCTSLKHKSKETSFASLMVS